MTYHVQAPRRPREDSPPGTSSPAACAGSENPASPCRPAATTSLPAGPGTAGAAGEPAAGDTTERKPDRDVPVLELTASLTAPSQARHYARVALARWQLSPEIARDTQTVVSELVTNAIAACGITPEQPAGPDPDDASQVTLALRRQPGQLVIEVTDPIPDPPAPDEPSLDAESGRGLMLVQALSTQWGCVPASGGGKTVFAVLALPA